MSPDVRRDAQQALGCAFLAAQELTGSADLAESTVLAAIEKWDPITQTRDDLLRLAVAGAARTAHCAAGQSKSTRARSISHFYSGGIRLDHGLLPGFPLTCPR